MAGIGIAIKGIGKALKRGVVDRNVKSKEVFKLLQEIKKPKKLKKFLKDKRTKAVGKGALVGGAVASGLEYKRRKDRGDYKK